MAYQNMRQYHGIGVSLIGSAETSSAGESIGGSEKMKENEIISSASSGKRRNKNHLWQSAISISIRHRSGSINISKAASAASAKSGMAKKIK